MRNISFARQFITQATLIIIGLFLSEYWNAKSGKEIEADIKKLTSVSEAGTLDKLKLEIKRTETLEQFKAAIVKASPSITKLISTKIK